MSSPWVDGENVNAVKLTSRVEDRLDTLDVVTAHGGCRLRRVANQSVANSSTQTISWDTADENSPIFISTPGTTITIPAGKSGTYGITFVADPATAPATRFICQLAISSAITGNPSTIRASGAGEDILSVSASLPLLAGDSFTCQVFQTSGAAMNFTAYLACYLTAP